MRRQERAICMLAKELMQCLSCKGSNYISYCRNYAKVIIENELFYDDETGKYYADGDDDVIEVSKFDTKTGNPITIDISEI